MFQDKYVFSQLTAFLNRTQFNNYVRKYDGLMHKPDPKNDVEQEWDNPDNRRIMFLLKDQPSDYTDDARKWLCDEPCDSDHNLRVKASNREIRSKFIHNIANVLYGLSQAGVGKPVEFESLSFEAVRDNFLAYPFAFIETKKQGGTTWIKNATLDQYLVGYGDLFEMEISILNPTLIVCTHHLIYGKVIKLYGGEEKMLKIPEHNRIRFCPEQNKLIFLSYHPSAIKSYREIYYGVMSHFHAFLQTDYAPQFFNGTSHHR